MSSTEWFSLLFTIGFMIVHIGSKYIDLPTASPRSPWLSLSGGATVAYIFLFLLPELERYLQAIETASEGSWLAYVEHHTYLIALFGLLIYFGLNTLVETRKQDAKSSGSSAGVFGVHASLFFLYNVTIGYLLVHGHFKNAWELALYFLALTSHFILTDHALKALHTSIYDRFGRWVLAAAVFLGWLTGMLVKLPELVTASAVSILAGGVILNSIKDELPGSKAVNYWTFAAGAVTIAVLQMLI